MELYNEIEKLMAELTKSIRLLRKNGNELAEAEKEYKVLLSQTALGMKASGTPVTLIQTVVYGNPKVADLRLKRDIAQSMYDANKEHINSVKLQLRILESQLQREWSVATKGDM